jgi:hypothetical protein
MAISDMSKAIVATSAVLQTRKRVAPATGVRVIARFYVTLARSPIDEWRTSVRSGQRAFARTPALAPVGSEDAADVVSIAYRDIS